MGLKYVDVDDQYKKYKDLRKQDVIMLKDWVDQQPHLPKMTELEVILFLHSCYYNNEIAKQTIDNYFTCRTHCPELFSNKDPFSKEIIHTASVVKFGQLPNLTKEGYVVFYVRMVNFNPDEYFPALHMKLFDMQMALLHREIGCVNGYIMVMDQTGGTLSHMLRVTLPLLKKMMFYIQECIPIRLKKLYFVHPVSFVDKILGLVRPLLKKELQDLIQVLPGDEIYKYIPKDNLPEEIGGTLGPVSKLCEGLLSRVQENAEFFSEDEKRLVDESKRPGKPKNSGELFGVEGTFKKLDID